MKKEKNENAEMSHPFAFFCHNFILIELNFSSWFTPKGESTLSEGKAKTLSFFPVTFIG